MKSWTQINIKKVDKKKVDRVSDITGLSHSTSFGILSESVPLILKSEIIKKRRRGRKVRITFQQDFQLP